MPLMEVILDYVTVRELREKSGAIWQRVEAGEEFVVTRNGKPFALLVHTEPQAVEERLRALRLSRMGDLVRAMQAQALASGAHRLTEEEIQTEIDAVRRARRPKPKSPAIAAEPTPPRYARRR